MAHMPMPSLQLLHNMPYGNRPFPSDSIRRIAVFRALQLGDMLCVVPALRALRATAPNARITLIGLPWAASFASRFDEYIDDFLEFPGFPGLPERTPALTDIPQFMAAAQQLGFDLALQMHGSGNLTNPVMVSMGATHNGGFFSVGQYCPQPALFYQWNEHEHEVLRYIRLLSLLGAAEQGTHLEFPVYESDYQSLLRSDTNLPKPGTYACIHPGSRLASRRWPPERFAEIGDRLALAGLTIVLTGSASEAALTAAVRKAMRMPCLDLTGKTDLGALAVLIGDSRIIVCNDTGVSHIAAAVATPSIVIASGSDPERWAPLNRSRHRLLHFPVSCRPCAHESCPLPEHLCAQNVTVEMVWEETASLLTEQSYAGMQVKEELSGEFVSASHIRH